ncbi:hypothetical protein CWI38_1690p0020 [Hamiltosporidium tvaerminnensis]|uniref:Uncharacterized protein n=1 Tax=Hamiltosporidium tvaerminnensis TaxID=1176355 RepID=A0A4Q9LQB7_9MICR|nr:hypothetical protein CWI38_1690p0020 [Hamiltosporidium tvaerminnensis]
MEFRPKRIMKTFIEDLNKIFNCINVQKIMIKNLEGSSISVNTMILLSLNSLYK